MTRRVLERLIAAIAVGSGCTSRATTGDDDDGTNDVEGSSSTGEDVPVDPSVGGGMPASTTGAGEGDGEVDDGEVDDGPKFDVWTDPPKPDVGGTFDPGECADVVGNPDFLCEPVHPGAPMHYLCIPPWRGYTCDDMTAYSAALEANQCIGASCSGPGYDGNDCGHDPSVTDACCYWIEYTDQAYCQPPGRPFVVDGEGRLADLVTGHAWSVTVTPRTDDLTPTERSALASMWSEHARFEHASVASFARFVMQLLAVGAPAELVAEATSAIDDELRHATAMFGLASAYAGRPLGPGPLDVSRGLEACGDLEAIVIAAVDEGCIAETVSALEVLHAARHARDPAVRSVLHAIADEELRHAELAWRFVSWALGRGGASLHRRVRAAFDTAARKAPRGPARPEGLGDEVMRRHGLVPAFERAAVARLALDEIVAPAAAALLSPPQRDAQRRRQDTPVPRAAS
jgi:hypothetical protein